MIAIGLLMLFMIVGGSLGFSVGLQTKFKRNKLNRLKQKQKELQEQINNIEKAL